MADIRAPSWNPRVVPVRRARWVIYPLLVLLAAPLVERIWQRHAPYNGFEVQAGSEAAARIEGGGPGRDDIPALDHPATLPAAEAGFLSEEDLVLGVVLGGEARAYPIRILDRHEVVNDRLGGEPVLITWCPLCRSGLAFSPRLGGERLLFGVSGLLYNGNLLMYDRDTESLWSQIRGEAVSGERRGQRLPRIAAVVDTWQRWRARHPSTRVLSRETGHRRDYDTDAYAGLEGRMVAARARDEEAGLAPGALVIGVEQRGRARAWPMTRLALEAPAGVIEDAIGERELLLRYDAVAGTVEVRDRAARLVPATVTYWAVWHDFHPHSEVWPD